MNSLSMIFTLAAVTTLPTAAFAASVAVPLQPLRTGAVGVALLAALGILVITAADYGRKRTSLLTSGNACTQRPCPDESFAVRCTAGCEPA